MSSSISGFGGSGSQNTVRYAIVIDDSQVNQKLSSFQSQLQQLNSATQSSGSGLSTINNNLQTLDTNLQNTSTDLDAINNNFRSMDSSVQSTSREMGALSNNFKGVEGGLTSLNTLQGQVTQSTQTLGQRMKSAGGFIKDNALAIGVVSSSIVGLVSSYTELKRSQLAATIANTNAEKAQQKVVKLQEKVNKLNMEGKQGTSEFAIATKDLALAQETAGNKIQLAALKTETANQNLARYIPESIQQITMLGAGAANMISGFRDITLSSGGIKTALMTIGAGFVGMAGPILAVVAAIWFTLGAIKAFNNVNALFTQNIETGGKAISLWEAQWLNMKKSAPQIFGTLTAEESKWLDAHNKNMDLSAEKAGVTSEQIQEEIKKGFINPIPDDVYNGIDSFIKKILGVAPAAGNAGEGLDTLGESSTNTVNSTGKFNDALDYQLGRLPQVTSAADEYAFSIDETGANAILGAEALEKYNRAFDYQKGTVNKATSAADEYALSIDETGESIFRTAENAMILDRQLVLQENQIETNRQLVKDYNKAWDDMAAAIKKAGEFINNSLEGPFEKFKTPAEELEKKLKKDLNKTFDVFPKLKADWKFIGKEDEVRQRLQEKLKAVFERNPITGDITLRPGALDIKDEDWDEWGNQLLGILNEKVAAGSTEFTALRNKIKAAIDNPDTAKAFTELMKDPEFIKLMNPIMEIEIAQKSINDLTTALTNAIMKAATNGGKGYPVKVIMGSDVVWDRELPNPGEDKPPMTFSSWLDTLTPAQRKAVIAAQKVYKKSPDSIDDNALANGYGGNWISPRDTWSYDAGPHFRTKDGVLWRQDATGRWSPVQNNQTILNKYGQGWYGNPALQEGKTNIAFGTGSQGTGAYRDPLGFMTNGSTGGSTFGTPVQANPLDTMARQILQIETNLISLAKQSSITFNSIGANAKSGGDQITNGIGLALINVAQGMGTLASEWSGLANSFGANATSAGNQISDGIGEGLINVAGGMGTLAKEWSKLANSMGKNAKSAGNQISDGIGKGLINVADGMGTLAKEWSKVCNSMGANAKSAAKQINNALGSIKDVSVTVKVGISGEGAAYLGGGGTIKLGKGGILSAAKGFTTNGPQLIMVGDNPGGHETIAAIPHNDPYPALNLLNEKFNRTPTGSDGSVVNQTIILQLNGNEIINERALSKKVRFEIGKNMDKYV